MYDTFLQNLFCIFLFCLFCSWLILFWVFNNLFIISYLYLLIWIYFVVFLLKFTKDPVDFFDIWWLPFAEDNILESDFEQFKFEFFHKLRIQFLFVNSFLKIINDHLFILNFVNKLVENIKLPFCIFFLFLFFNFLEFLLFLSLFETLNEIFNKLLVFSLLLIQKG